jgi:hypothetical protein
MKLLAAADALMSLSGHRAGHLLEVAAGRATEGVAAVTSVAGARRLAARGRREESDCGQAGGPHADVEMAGDGESRLQVMKLLSALREA